MDACVWRYLDSMKLFDLLINQKLHCARIDCLGDPREASHNRVEQNYYLNFAQQYLAESPHSEYADQYANMIPDVLKRTTYVNSWCMSECEDALLWCRYASSGYAVRAKCKNILDSVCSHSLVGHASLGCVEYIDWESRSVDNVSSMATLCVQKDLAYRGEQEVRLVVVAMPSSIHRDEDDGVDLTDTPSFVRLDLNVEMLIDSVVVSPWTPRWHVDVLRNLCDQLQLEIAISESSILIS